MSTFQSHLRMPGSVNIAGVDMESWDLELLHRTRYLGEFGGLRTPSPCLGHHTTSYSNDPYHSIDP